jgi:hypothetical protein
MIKSANSTIQKDFLNWYNLVNRDQESGNNENYATRQQTPNLTEQEPVLTGNSEADEEIKKFWSMRNQLVRNSLK